MAQRYKEIILHAGPGKTGSTSIQKNCDHHRKLLAQHGFVYPAFQLKERRLINHSDAITTAVCVPPTAYGAGWRQGTTEEPGKAKFQLRCQWNPLLAEPQGEVLILSGESVAEYSDQDLQTLGAELEEHCERLRVFAFIRSPESSLESMLQQRLKGGTAVEPESILGVVKTRYENLTRNFPEQLEVFDFHEAVQHPKGLVGFFLEQCGLPSEELPEDAFEGSNERMSIEGYRIMYDINSRYSKREQSRHGIERRFNDLRPLRLLPGIPFQLEGFSNSRLHRALAREGRWLERETGFSFPPLKERSTEELWQDETLEELEDTIMRLKEPALRLAAGDFLVQEARRQIWRDLDKAAVLAHIGEQLSLLEDTEAIKKRRHHKRQNPQSLEELKQTAAPWYRHKLVQESPWLRLPLALKRRLGILGN